MKTGDQITVKMPFLEADEAIAYFIKWLAAVGDQLEIDQDLAEFTVAGKPFILPSPLDGRLVEGLLEAGDIVEPGQEVAVVEIE
jgi:pyruvate/2-oxoglutarate dehydrogenase complex dihydrolipoamide acyltransferase (E2) component